MFLNVNMCYTVNIPEKDWYNYSNSVHTHTHVLNTVMIAIQETVDERTKSKAIIAVATMMSGLKRNH